MTVDPEDPKKSDDSESKMTSDKVETVKPAVRDVSPTTATETTDGMSATGWILLFLVVLLIGAGGALYLSPKIMPYLPASVAQYLQPVQDHITETFAILQNDIEVMQMRIQVLEKIEDELQPLQERVEELEQGYADLQTVTSSLKNQLDREPDMNNANTPVEKTLDITETDVSPSNPLTSEPVDSSNVQLEDIMGKVTALESRFEQQKQTMQMSPSNEAVMQIRQRLAELEKETVTLDEQTSGNTPKLESLSDRVREIEEKLRERFKAQETIGLGAAVSNLVTQAGQMTPFTDQLDVIEKMTGTPAPEALKAYAQSGVPSVLLLTSRFEESSLKALRAETRESDPNNQPSGFWQKVKRWGSSLVTVRPQSEQDGDTPSAYISQAETRLKAGDLKAAVKILGNLPPASQDAMADWIKDAQDRVALDTLVAQYRDTLLNTESGE